MNVQGEHWLPASPEVVWKTIHDEAILKATIPGCRELTQTSPTSFSGAANVGMGAIKGLYRGILQLEDEQPFSAATIRIDTRSGHAEIHGSGSVELQPSNNGTLVRYQGDARISGMLAVVGQRLLPSASKSLAEQFLKNVEQILAKQGSGR